MLKAPGSNPPEELKKVQPADLHVGDIVYIKRPKLHAVDDETSGNVRGINIEYYECEVGKVSGRLVIVNQEPIPSHPPGHRENLPAGTELPIDNLDPNDFYQEVT